MTLSQSSPRDTQPAGIVNLYKPVGRTSAAYVYRLRPIFGLRRVGHAGTLDPFADGVLLGCVGRATSLFETLTGLTKHYQTTLRLGVTNETFDTERAFEPVPGATAPARAAVEEAVAALVGEIEQVPPVFSAMRIGGRSSYHLARAGKTIALAARKVRIDRAAVLAYEWPMLRLDIVCGRGTYIRSIARDIGAALGCGACCETLTRCAVGPFTMEDAAHLDQLSREEVRARLIDLETIARRIAPYQKPPE